MEKILFITSRNIVSVSGELRLIKNRALSLEKDYSINTEFIAYRLRKPTSGIREKLNGKLTVYLNPFDRINIIKDVGERIKTNKYLCIILSGPFVFFLLSYIKKIDYNIKIIVDMHGTIEELKEFQHFNFAKRLSRSLLYCYGKEVEKKYLPKADGILVVSKALEQFIKKYIKIKNNNFFIVPCAVDGNLSYEKYCIMRDMYRLKYSITKETLVFVYSGGNSAWQCVEQTVVLFEKIKDHIIDKKCKMLLFSGSKELIRKYEGNKNIIIDSLNPEEVSDALCAGDFGMMLRGDFVTNNVAFPNKFLEYILSGLRVIATPYVYDVKNYIQKYDMGIIINSEHDYQRVCDVILNEYSMIDHFKKRDELLKVSSFKETLRPFVEFIRE